jgi:hypothetical protein
VRCNNGAKIFVPVGSYLHITGSTQTNSNVSAGCDLMWQGFVVQGGGKIEINQTKIQDAVTAVTLDIGAGWQISNNSEFDKNVTAIVIQGSPSFTSFIKTTTFDHSTLLADPSQTTDHYGTAGIVFTGAATAVMIGGSTTSDGCHFIKG